MSQHCPTCKYELPCDCSAVSDIVDRIAAVLEAEQELHLWDHNDRKYVAERITAELQLSEERENFGTVNGGILRRWVSAWSEAQP